MAALVENPAEASADPKPYHHGDLSRALLAAAWVVLERDGPAALSLRAVAREAGVSPAAPYHHFKDKNDLINAIAREGFARLRLTLSSAIAGADVGDRGSCLGVAYVEFAQAHPALYRVMYDRARDGEGLLDDEDEPGGAYRLVKDTLAQAAGEALNPLDLELTAIAAWCAAHGLAEMSKFEKFKPLRDRLGGERAFVRAVLDHVGVMRAPPRE